MKQREYPNHPLVGVGALIVQTGRVVLIKRGKAPLQGEWSIPGGMLELGEILRAGAEREALEETGLVVRATELLGVFDRVVPDRDQRMRQRSYLLRKIRPPSFKRPSRRQVVNTGINLTLTTIVIPNRFSGEEPAFHLEPGIRRNGARRMQRGQPNDWK